MSACNDLHPGGRHQGGEEYELRLVAVPSDVPAIIRLRHVLKSLLRAYGFRAVSVRDVTPVLPPLPATLPGKSSVVTQGALEQPETH
jgi:hypothetical protein